MDNSRRNDALLFGYCSGQKGAVEIMRKCAEETLIGQMPGKEALLAVARLIEKDIRDRELDS